MTQRKSTKLLSLILALLMAFMGLFIVLWLPPRPKKMQFS